MRKWLKNIRKSEQLTQAQLATLVGVDVTSINKYELGERRPSPEVAQRIANKLNFEKHGYSWTYFYESRESITVWKGGQQCQSQH